MIDNGQTWQARNPAGYTSTVNKTPTGWTWSATVTNTGALIASGIEKSMGVAMQQASKVGRNAQLRP